MATVPSLPKPWFPSFYTWEPVCDSAGKQKLGLRMRRGIPEEIFGLFQSGISHAELILHLRAVFAQAVVGQTIVPFLRMPARVFSFLAGDFVNPGLRKAEIAWELRCQKAVRTRAGNPDRCIRVALQVFYVAQQALKHVAKLALYVVVGCPLGPLWWIAVYGAFLNPFDAQHWFGKVEGWTARDHVPIVRCARIPGFEMRYVQIADYLMPCSQVNTTIDSREFEQLKHGSYFEIMSTGRLVVLQEMLTERREFFENQGVKVTEILAILKRFRGDMRGLGIGTSEIRNIKQFLDDMKVDLRGMSVLSPPEVVQKVSRQAELIQMTMQRSRQISLFSLFLIRAMLQKELVTRTAWEQHPIREWLETQMDNLSAYRIPTQFSEEFVQFEWRQISLEKTMSLKQALDQSAVSAKHGTLTDKEWGLLQDKLSDLSPLPNTMHPQVADHSTFDLAAATLWCAVQRRNQPIEQAVAKAVVEAVKGIENHSEDVRNYLSEEETNLAKVAIDQQILERAKKAVQEEIEGGYIPLSAHRTIWLIDGLINVVARKIALSIN